MTAEELLLPWAAFVGAGTVRWRAVLGYEERQLHAEPYIERIRSETQNGELRANVERHEFLDLCAAIELGRVQPRDVPRLISMRRARRVERRRWTWPALMDGARGLGRSDAQGTLPVAEALRRVGLVWVRAEFWDPARAEAA